MCRHWKQENIHFSNELANWKNFRKYQQDLQHLDRLETGLELRNMDAALIKSLTSLSDWQDFELFQYHNLTEATNLEDHCRQKFLEITEWKASTEQSSLSSPPYKAVGAWLYSFDRSQTKIEAAKKQLKWIKDQWPKVATEAFASVAMTPKLQSSLEGYFEKQALSAFNAIRKAGGRPSHAVSPPDESMDVLHRVLYWISETSKYRDELLHWKHFFEWQRGKLGEDFTMQRGEYQCHQLESVLEYSTMFEEFRKFEHETALTWLERWRRVVRWYEEELGSPRWHALRTEKPHREFPPKYLYVYAEAAHSHVKKSEQAVVDAASRLGKSRQEHAHALSQHGGSFGNETGIECPQKPCLLTPSLPDANSLQSSQSSSFSSSQVSISSSSPASSHSSQSSVPPQSPQRSHTTPSPQASERMCKGRKLSNECSPANKRYRRSNKKNTRKEAKIKTIDTEQQALPTFVSDSHIVEDDDDIPMENFSEDSSSLESIEQSYGAKSEDTVMTEVTDPPDLILPEPSQPSRPIPNTKIRNLATLAQGPIRKMTRSATKLDQAPNNRVTKNTNKKPATKAKAFTKQQTTMLLDAASNTHSTITGPPLRRSERLKEKATLSAATAIPQLNAVQPSQQRQLQETANLMESSQSTTRKKRKREDEEIEPLPDSAQKRRRTR